MSLSEEIEKNRQDIRTDAYSMSIGEWISLYENNELDIHPEFQRFYRWDNVQKSNFIESILLGIPIPPIFVSQRRDGVWDVIDGLQRLSSIFQLIGICKDENETLLAPLKLEKTKYLPSLLGKRWEDTENILNSLTHDEKLIIKRTKLAVNIILMESDERTKYELFQRLNTGGSILTPQEVRNCIMVMINPSFYKKVRELANFSQFQDAISLSQNNLEQQYDIELLLRFIIFSTINIDEYDRSADVGDYLTDQMVTLAEDSALDWSNIESRFYATFDFIAKNLGGNAFRRFAENRFLGGFLLSPFEVIAFGLGFNFPNFPKPEKFISITKDLYSNPIYIQSSGSGIRANTRLPKLIPLGRDLYRE
ncbi:MAG: DUF262 domain-containing protein [Syntrophaceae bacterium]|nr:DUF262 domain-containing protein [Syntrophaceae bacterium]